MDKNMFYEKIAEKNREAMLKSYYKLHHSDDNNNSKTLNQTEFYIFKNIDYNNLNSMKNGLNELYTYINNIETYYLSKGEDPDEIDYCNELWEKYIILNQQITNKEKNN